MDGCSFHKFYFKMSFCLEMVFVLTQENASSEGFILKSIERPYVPLKSGSRDFKNSPPFKRSWQSLGILNVFNTLT